MSTASTTEGSVETSGHFPTGRERGFDEISVSFKPTETKLDSSRLPRSTNTFPRTKKSQHVCIEIPFKPLDLTIFQHIPFLPPSFFLPCQVFSCCILTLRIFHPQMTAMNKDGGRSCRRGIKTTSSVELRLQYRSLSLTRNKIKNASAPVSNDTLPHSPSLHLREAPKSILRWCYFPVASMGLEVEARTQFCSAFF